MELWREEGGKGGGRRADDGRRRGERRKGSEGRWAGVETGERDKEGGVVGVGARKRDRAVERLEWKLHGDK